uniref:Ran binding protein 9-related n=1 Tax=Schistosoma mansoni TaxID=6183 RepID=A0A5K4EU76_SCHMA
MAFTLDDDKRCQLNEDIIKQLYLVAYMQGSKLPTSLVTNSKCSKVQVRGDGRTAVDMRSHVHQTVLPVVIKADHPIPVSCSVYYFEITVNVKSRSGLLALGVCSSRSSTNEWPGMEFTSYGYHSNSGTIYHNSKELPISAPSFGESDIIGCGVNFVNNSVFFTKNGVFVGPISAGKKLPHPVYPCIAFACPNCHVSVNFGHHKFAYNIGQYIARERAVAISTAVDRKCNDQLAYVTMRNLVATYLLHNGFLESAQALGEWVTKASIDSSTTTDENNEVTDNNDYNVHHNDNSSSNYDTNGKSPVKLSASETPNGSCPSSINKHIYQRDSITNFANGTCHLDDDHNHSNHNTTNTDNTSFTLDELGGEQQSKLPTTALTSQHYRSKINLVKSSKDTILNDLFRWPEAVDILLRRRHLRETIRNGDYLSALDQLKTYFKTLWENDPSITFVLKCHHFIDLIRQHYTTNSSKEPSSLNGLSDNNNIDSNIRKTLQSNGLDTHRNSQKRVKPSSHSESSPEITTTPNKHDCQCKHLINSNHNHHSMNSELTAHTTIDATNNTNNSIINRSSCLTSTTNNYNHSHNNSSDYQSPIRLRFNLPSNEWNNNGSLSPAISDQYSSEILPSVFPKNGPSANGTGVSLDCITNGNNNDDNSSEIICPVMFPVYAENNHIKANEIITNGNSMYSPIDDDSTLSLSKIDSIDHENNSMENKQNGDLFHSINSNGFYFDDSVNSNHHPHHHHHNYFDNNNSDDDVKSVDQILNNELRDLIEYGRNLRSSALELQRQGVISLEQWLLLSDAFSLVAYQNPYKSPLSGLLHPKYRELLADAVNDAILVHLKQPCRPVLDIALTYLEHVLTDEGSSCKTTNNGSFAFYRFKSGQSNASGLSVDPLQNRNATTRTTADDICLTSRTNHTPIHESTITPASRDTPTTPNRSIAVGIMHRDDIDDEPRHITTDIQTYALSLNEFNGSTNLLRPASTSIISSSLYVPPSALISLTGRNNNPITRSSDVQRSSLSTSRTRPTSLQNLIHQRHQSQLIDNQSTTTMTGTTTTAATTSSSTSSPSHFNRFLVTTASWPVSTSFSSSTSNNTTATTTITTTTTTTTQNPNRFSPSRITVTSSLTNTHAPTGPELAGFFHPILFIG